MKFKNAAGHNMPSMHRLPAGTYHWCQCGETKNVPFCDGSHEGMDIEPLAFESTGKGTMSLCNCGLTTHAPACDGKHQDYR
jgi:CDGSH iron-sulfur domain-containing protein 3